MTRFIASLTINESEGLHETEDTTNFQVPSRLQEFEIYGETIDYALKVAKKKLMKISNDQIEVAWIDEKKEIIAVTFSNCEDGLGITYEIMKGEEEF